MFVAGEATGVGGAELALAEGELAGFAAAAHAATPLTAGIDGNAGPLGPRRADGARRAAPPRATSPRCAPAARSSRTSPASSPTSSTRGPGLLELADADTTLCRCEDVTAGAVDAAVAGGATTLSALKVVTRCGQGPCQGRVCERLVAARVPEPERFSARAPIRPIPLGLLMAEATDS